MINVERVWILDVVHVAQEKRFHSSSDVHHIFLCARSIFWMQLQAIGAVVRDYYFIFTTNLRRLTTLEWMFTYTVSFWCMHFAPTKKLQ